MIAGQHKQCVFGYRTIYPLSSQDESFQEATLITTLAETFSLTNFKLFTILSVLEGRDAVVIQPAGSGKSLCFQFPVIYQYKLLVAGCVTNYIFNARSGYYEKAKPIAKCCISRLYIYTT